MHKPLVKPGDIIEIPLANDRFAYAQFIDQFEQGHLVGPLLRVLKPIRLCRVIDVSEISVVSELFEPVFVGINPPIRSKRWSVIGNREVTGFQMPHFREIQDLHFSPGRKNKWSIILPDGTRQFVGLLPDWAKDLGFAWAYSFEALEQRIETGRFLGDQMY